jgi:hypothetical protein
MENETAKAIATIIASVLTSLTVAAIIFAIEYRKIKKELDAKFQEEKDRIIFQAAFEEGYQMAKNRISREKK